MKTIEVYKGYSILEAEGDHLAAGFKFQIDINPGSRHRFLAATGVLRSARGSLSTLEARKNECGLAVGGERCIKYSFEFHYIEDY